MNTKTFKKEKVLLTEKEREALKVVANLFDEISEEMRNTNSVILYFNRTLANEPLVSNVSRGLKNLVNADSIEIYQEVLL